MEIKVKLFIIMVSLVIVTLLVASIISINSFSTGMISEIRKHQEDNSVSTMNKISKTMFDRISDIKFLTDPNNIILSQPIPTEKKLEYLKSVLQIDRHTYDLATIFDKNGKEIGDTSNSGVVGTNALHEAFFKIAARGDIYLDKAPVFSNKSSNTRIIRTAGPLYDSPGKVTGVLLLVFPFGKISQILQTESTLPYTEINLVSTNGS
ncbi:MAG TPA: hypothetical protein VEP90_02605, partial [Methylomirabilota bacterium]|nr:hypothetical protein [Methylomirabilota bacterium]